MKTQAISPPTGTRLNNNLLFTKSQPKASSTNKIILDYLLYLSIQSRLKQAYAEQDKNAVESMIAGILSSRQNTKPSFQTDANFEQRLHLCQLTNLVFGRLDATCTGYAIAHNSTRRKRHAHMASLFSVPVKPSFCRRHPQYERHCPPAGLIEAIPTFLKTSADMLRHTLETGEDEDCTPLTFAGQKVMGGGMPPRWYDLFLELLTQAGIESYLCDGQAGLEPIFEIFSYGDVEDEEEAEEEAEGAEVVVEEEAEAEEAEEAEADEEEEEEEDVWGVRAADHHLLFPKTRTMYLFKTQFLVLQEGDTLRQHFERLAQRYPLETFEKNMREFIQMTLSTMDIPALDKYETVESELSSASPVDSEKALPFVYKFPGDGALLMPEIPDHEEERGQKRSIPYAYPEPKRAR
ncbi:hypothetical protein BDF14DRAFT_1720494 [Spinellus fusiger]|nr:hypothetical protein BDF14DRAFT_1720494 [Spinellus fusiger]